MKSVPKFVVLFAILASSSSLVAQTPDSCRGFVQHFYDEYLKDDLHSANYATEISSHPERFSATLRAALLRQAKRRDIDVIDFDPFLNAQDWAATYKVGETDVHQAKCTARVGSTSSTSVVQLGAELSYVNQTWHFTDFIYPRGNGRVRLTSLLKKDTSR